jgi:pimeloyl-ACP methyl ester carboxylesterase
MTTGAPDPREVPVGDGTVGVYDYGDPNGAPVMVFHGTPACGAGFAWADEPARERGLRLIAPDRPGVGLSTRVAGWTVGDYPAMVSALADALGIDRFAVWGYSGGGPYAVACAARLPGRLRSAVVSAGMGQVGVWAQADDFERTDRLMLGLAITRPWLARFLLMTSVRVARLSPKRAGKSFEKQLNAQDREIVPALGTPAEAMALFTQAFLRGAHGVVDDYAALAQPWGVALDEIAVPVVAFHGDADTMVPLRHSEELAARVPDARLTVWPGAGHLGTVTYVGEILDALKAQD